MRAHLMVKLVLSRVRRAWEASLLRIDTWYTHFDDYILKTFHPQGKVGREQALRNELWQGIGIGMRRELVTVTIVVTECEQCHRLQASQAEPPPPRLLPPPDPYKEQGKLSQKYRHDHLPEWQTAELPIIRPTRSRVTAPLHPVHLISLNDEWVR